MRMATAVERRVASSTQPPTEKLYLKKPRDVEEPVVIKKQNKLKKK
jgi:hypothetical protein